MPPRRASRSPAASRPKAPPNTPVETPKDAAAGVKTPKDTKAPKQQKARPLYFSDGDSRPAWRGTFYAIVRESGAAYAVLASYVLFSLWSFGTRSHVPLLLCRLAHALSILLNVVLSDDLHNLDKHLGPIAYFKPTTKALEQRLHAQDWCAALAVPATYHILLLFGIVDAARVEPADGWLLVANLTACLAMCWRTTPERITPKRELFLSFVATFGIQSAPAGDRTLAFRYTPIMSHRFDASFRSGHPARRLLPREIAPPHLAATLVHLRGRPARQGCRVPHQRHLWPPRGPAR